MKAPEQRTTEENAVILTKRFGSRGTFWGKNKRSLDVLVIRPFWQIVRLKRCLLLYIHLRRSITEMQFFWLHSCNVKWITQKWKMSWSFKAKVKGLVPLCVSVSRVCYGSQTTIKNSCAIICVFVQTKIHLLPASWRHFGRSSRLQRAAWSWRCGFKVRVGFSSGHSQD